MTYCEKCCREVNERNADYVIIAGLPRCLRCCTEAEWNRAVALDFIGMTGNGAADEPDEPRDMTRAQVLAFFEREGDDRRPNVPSWWNGQTA